VSRGKHREERQANIPDIGIFQKAEARKAQFFEKSGQAFLPGSL
jgi:hypothetical protein